MGDAARELARLVGELVGYIAKERKAIFGWFDRNHPCTKGFEHFFPSGLVDEISAKAEELGSSESPARYEGATIRIAHALGGRELILNANDCADREVLSEAQRMLERWKEKLCEKMMPIDVRSAALVAGDARNRSGRPPKTSDSEVQAIAKSMVVWDTFFDHCTKKGIQAREKNLADYLKTTGRKESATTVLQHKKTLRNRRSIKKKVDALVKSLKTSCAKSPRKAK